MKKLIAAIAFLAVATPAFAADTASLTVTVEGLTAKGGNLRLGVYDESIFSVRGAKPTIGTIVAATAGKMVVTLTGILPGVYGVKTFQDENGNNKLDTSFIGMPTEPFGISRDAKPNMGPPAFDDAKITLKPGANAITIHLQ